MFLKQLQLILKSGISILKGIALLEKRLDKTVSPICGRLLIDLQAGRALSEAMKRNPLFFSELIITLTAAGEQSGELVQILKTLTDYYQNQQKLQNFILKALIYPLFLITASIGVMLFFLMYVLPILATTYTAMQAQPTSFLKTVLLLHSFLTNNYWIPLGIVLFFIIAAYYSKHLFIKALLSIDWCKKSYNLMLEARFCKLLALLLTSGINITEAVIIAGSTVNDKNMLNKLQMFKDYLQRGIEMQQALSHSQGLFSPLTEELLTIGVTTGYLPHMLEEAASIAENDLRERLEKVRELLAPTLLLIAAVFTAGIVVSIMGPLFDLFTAIPDY